MPLYEQNSQWNKYFIDFEDTSRIRSTRSYKSKLAYAESQEVNEKPALYIYPFYLEPLYILEFNDLQKDTFALLMDRKKRKCYEFFGKNFKEKEANEKLSLKDFVNLAKDNYFEPEELSFVQDQEEH